MRKKKQPGTDFKAAGSDVAELEIAVIDLLIMDEESALENLPQSALDRLFAKSLESRSIEAAASLLSAGAKIKNLKFETGHVPADLRVLLERAVEIQTSRHSAPDDLEKNLKAGKMELRTALRTLNL